MNKEIHPAIQTIITNIKSIRKEKGYSQDYLAAKLGITQNAYSKIELGKTAVAISKLYKIADILEVDALQLLQVCNSDSYQQTVGADNGINGQILQINK